MSVSDLKCDCVECGRTRLCVEMMFTEEGEESVCTWCWEKKDKYSAE